MRALVLAAAAAFSFAAPAAAATIDVAGAETNNEVSFWTRTISFFLPSDATNVSLGSVNAASDDIMSMALNGNVFGYVGINLQGNQPRVGAFTNDSGATFQQVLAQPNGLTTYSVNTGFLTGALNSITFVINNNNRGIDPGVTQLTGGPSQYAFNGTVSFDVGAVPEPATWAMLIIGFGLAGTALRGQRRTALATA